MILKLSEDDRIRLQQLEEDLWRQETRFDLPYMEEVFARDFFEFGRSGRTYTRQEALSLPSQPIDAVLPLADFQARLLTPDVAQVTYNSAVIYDGVVEFGRRSSIWTRTNDSWELRFHQGTPYNGDES